MPNQPKKKKGKSKLPKAKTTPLSPQAGQRKLTRPRNGLTETKKTPGRSKRDVKQKSLTVDNDPQKHRLKIEEESPEYVITQRDLFGNGHEGSKRLGYSPTYNGAPFTNFRSINTLTDLTALNLNWREADLPEKERTKHVHRLHPYLGKYIPQLVEIFLRKFAPKAVYDPFAGSGTTLVEAKALGIDAIGSDVSAFNCLLMKVKTDAYDLRKLEHEIRDSLDRLNSDLKQSLFADRRESKRTDNAYLQRWFHPNALAELLLYRELLRDYDYSDVLKVILSRAARSARLTTHFDLDFPKHPQTEPYHCYKHSRTCQPTDNALQFLNRYALDTLHRIKEFARNAKPNNKTVIIHGDARFVDLPCFDLVVTSPPYVGLIDYHEQHRYAYELLNLPLQADVEIGAAFKGNSERARKNYCREIADVFANVRRHLKRSGHVVVVVNDKNDLYDYVAQQTGFVVQQRLKRHVNRRTGRRSGDFFEEVLIWRRND
jgi:DNA modification methylase